NVGIVGVQSKLDVVNLGAEATARPYSVTWNTGSVANGPHVLTAIARDGSGNSTTAASVTVTVSHDAVAPTVTMTAPGGGATVAGTAITVSATATDNDSVAGVQFMLDGAPLGAEVTTSPYSVVWNTTMVGAGSHTLTAVARDAAGNTTTAGVTVTVDNSAPTLTGTTPASGATGVATLVAVTATFSDGLDSATVTTTTVTLRDPASTLVPVTVSYDGASRTVTLTPAGVLALATSYTATVKGGASGLKDAA